MGYKVIHRVSTILRRGTWYREVCGYALNFMGEWYFIPDEGVQEHLLRGEVVMSFPLRTCTGRVVRRDLAKSLTEALRTTVEGL